MQGNLDRPPITIIGERQSVAAAMLPSIPIAALFGLIGYAPLHVLIHNPTKISAFEAIGTAAGAGLIVAVIAAFWLLLLAAAIKPPRVRIAPEGIRIFPSVGPSRAWSWADVDEPFLQPIPKSDGFTIVLNRRGKPSSVGFGYRQGIYPLGSRQMIDLINAGKVKWGGGKPTEAVSQRAA